MPQPILDSHIHLWPGSAANPQSHNWMQPGAHLSKQYSINDYLKATAARREDFEVKGFVYVETDRAIHEDSGADVTQWAAEPLEELAFLRRIVENTPDGDEGFGSGHSDLLRGIVAWAPLNRSMDDLAQYMAAAKEVAGAKTWAKVKGFRYLVQGIRDERAFRQLLEPQSSFSVGILKSLGQQGFSFDVGVDQRQGGVWQLELFADCIEHVHQGAKPEEKTVFIINHLCKPDMEQPPTHDGRTRQDFARWKSAISRMAKQQNVYMKLSGAFSEIVDQSPEDVMPVRDIAEFMRPWLDHVFGEFGCHRTMFGSDWPVCNVRGPGDDKSWGHWIDVVDLIMRSRGFSKEEMDRVWHGTAAEAYRLEPI